MGVQREKGSYSLKTRQSGGRGTKRKKMLFSRTELRRTSDRVGGAGDRQMQGARIKRTLFSRTEEQQTYYFGSGEH